MDRDRSFSIADLRSRSEKDQIVKCRELAAHSARLAETGNDEVRKLYSVLAVCWAALAEVKERTLGN